ncbi:unnamed protein product [Boreogadus saida]
MSLLHGGGGPRRTTLSVRDDLPLLRPRPLRGGRRTAECLLSPRSQARVHLEPGATAGRTLQPGRVGRPIDPAEKMFSKRQAVSMSVSRFPTSTEEVALSAAWFSLTHNGLGDLQPPSALALTRCSLETPSRVWSCTVVDGVCS